MKYEDIPEVIRDKMNLDELKFGNGYCLKKEDGTYERIDPMTVKLNPITKEFDIKEKSFNEQFPSLKEKEIGMVPTELEFPEDGRRKCTLHSNSKIICEQIKRDKRAYRIDFCKK